MKNNVVIRKIFHRERWRLAVFFKYDEKIRRIVTSIAGTAFSSTNRCFYLDDTEENLDQLLKSLGGLADIMIEELKEECSPVQRKEKAHLSADLKSSVTTEEIYNKMDSAKYEEKSFYGKDKGRITSVPYHKWHERTGDVEFRINENEGLLVIKFLGRYDPGWIEEMKTYGRCYYDKRRKEWLLRWSQLTCDSLADYFAGCGVEVNVTKQTINRELLEMRKATGDEIRSRLLGRKALDGLELLEMYLDENRYSPRTRESYLSMLDFFFRYFNDKEPEDITEDEISRFIYDFIIKLGYSSTYQNQLVSAIKTYYTITGKGKVNPDILERPRRRRALPKVFSKEEVVRILNSSRNVKHKLLLWMVYSCGLRRSEVTNIKLVDLDRDRGLLYIREGKGGVDRIVPVSEKVWEKIDDYMISYRPHGYLFEGQTGGRYSSESVYRVFKDALLRAGIKKEVGVHSLRHSYATHLHESGLDIRYIQELLGHRNSRTTEIYTHVSRRNLMAVRSPIEDLDVK